MKYDSPLPVRTACVLALAVPGICPAQDDPAVAALADRVVVLRTLDAADHDFRDLEPLIERIGDARIVVLGEASHSEGTAAAVKARLAIFLHERMGFDVLAWEAGVLDCAALDRALRDPGEDLRDATRQMMRGGWDSLAQVWPLFEYARASWRTPRPLRMAGFDGERPPHGSRHFLAAVRELEDAGVLQPDAERARQLRAFAERAFGYIRSGATPLAEDERSAQLAAVREVEAALAGPRAARTLSPIVAGRLRASIAQGYASEERKHRSATGDSTDVEHPRDPAMARSFRWLAEGEFARRRILIWAATAHLTRNTRTLVPIEESWDYAEAEHMGDTVHRDYGDDLYTIAVTSHHGTLGRIHPEGSARTDRTSALEPPPAGSFEARAHALGEPFLFVDLRGAGDDSWLAGSFVARPLGHIPTRAVWRDVIDAFLFVDEAEPETTR